MPRRIRREEVSTVASRLESELTRLRADLPSLELRNKVLRLVDMLHSTKSLGVNIVRDEGLDANAGLERMRLYLVTFVGRKIHGAELEVVGGISEYARRLRQLRVEQGYQIATGQSPDPEVGIDLKADEYLLVTAEPDTGAAARWKTANQIRKLKTSCKDRVLTFLKANVGKIVTTEELAYVGRNKKEFARRARELRTEDGYAVATIYTGRPDLNAGQYVLETLERIAEPHDRHIPTDTQRIVYERDRNTCQLCGWERQRWTRDDPRILELHHVEHHAEGGQNVPENLIVLCSRCHDEVHAGRLQLPLQYG